MATTYAHSGDITDAWLAWFFAMCKRIGASPFDLLGVAMNESGITSHALDRNGWAAGFWQLMPDTARGLGWRAGDARWVQIDDFRKAYDVAEKQREVAANTGDKKGVANATLAMQAAETGINDRQSSLMEEFANLDSFEQLTKWWSKYWGQYAGKIGSVSACYCACFLPLFLPHADDPNFVLAARAGPRAAIYRANSSFDHAGKGTILMSDPPISIEQACVGPRWNEFVARVQALIDADDVPPVVA